MRYLNSRRTLRGRRWRPAYSRGVSPWAFTADRSAPAASIAAETFSANDRLPAASVIAPTTIGPTANLDSHRSAEIVALLGELAGEGRAVLLVTHDAEAAAGADRVLELRDGQLAASVLPSGPIG